MFDLFSVYNTSRYMRALASPFLVQTVATKSLRLYFYQEYVRRVGIKFVFDHFDLQRDRVVFRPQERDHQQYRFKCGRTLQTPQLEEIEVKNTTWTGNVQCLGGRRYFTVRREEATRQAIPTIAVSESIANEVTEPGTSVNATATMNSPSATSTATEHLGSLNTAGTNENDKRALRKPTTDEKSYQSTKNFLDKTCPINIRKDGTHTVDGVRYCFLQSYPWSMQYQVDYESLDPVSTSANGNGSLIKKGSTFFINVRENLRLQTLQQPTEQDPAQVNGNNNDGEITSPVDDVPANSSPLSLSSLSLPLVRSKSLEPSTATSSGNKGIGSNSGARFFRVQWFECSMNFLDPKRATRNIIGRWIEGQVHHWKKVLGVKKPALLQQQPRQQQQQGSTTEVNSGATRARNGNSNLGSPDPRGSHRGARPFTDNVNNEGQHQTQPTIHDFDRNAMMVKAF